MTNKIKTDTTMNVRRVTLKRYDQYPNWGKTYEEKISVALDICEKFHKQNRIDLRKYKPKEEKDNQ